ncbi:hypothetical protein CEXT_643261 [Caerostris extrusa]|uniref:Uncharacterized protein n=1 Tax=Caerostris extrusa TaxID=172846 RepID=A0AAV4SVI4_CAEEX|nr:hypothetical protein CEXT_643261 [Caerostris extrusa]
MIRVNFSSTKRPQTPTLGIYMGKPTYSKFGGQRKEPKTNIKKIQPKIRFTIRKEIGDVVAIKRTQFELKSKYRISDLVAIKRTQFGTSLMLRLKYQGPYEVVNCDHSDRYDARKVGQPNITTASADLMKP